ncbi:MAG: type II secretion system F family protein [Myxococcota bacterium]
MAGIDPLKLGFAAASFVAALCLALFVVSRRVRPVRQLGLRGLRRRRSLAANDAWRFAEPALRWLGSEMSRFISQSLRARLEAQLVRAGDPLGLEPEELLVLTLLCGLGGASLGALYAFAGQGSPLSILILAVGLGLVPFVRIDSLAGARAQRIQRGLPSVVDLICLGLSAGLDFPAAIRQIVERSAQKDDALIDELSLVLSEIQLGKTRREALEGFALRNPLDSVKEFVGFVVQSEEEGNPLAQILSVQATVSRQRRAVRAEEMASKASLKIIMPVGLVMLSVLILIAAPLMLNVIGEMSNGL